MADAKRDDNFVPTLLAVSSVDGVTPVPVYANPITHRLLVDIPSGSGTVSDVSVVSANGFAGTVATSTTTPAITLTTTITGLLKGNGTAISAAAAGDADLILPTQTGNNGKYLTTNGTASSWAAIAGGGDVTKVGTPLNNQVGVWTGDGTIEGDAGLTFDTTTDLLTTGILNATSLTASEIVITDASKNLVSAAVATYPSLTELTYLKGVTSGIQGQLNAKGSGTVTAVSVATANGVSGSSSGGATPALTISLGAITPSTVNGNTITTGTGTLTLGAGKTLTANNSITLAGTDATTMTFPTTSATLARTDAANTFTGVQTMTSPVINTSLELGHATENTLTASGGVLSIEGVVIPSISSTNTLTNKRITKRTGTTTSSATPTINTDNVDFYSITAQTEAITSFTTNLSGTPTEGQTLWIAITGTAARAITWGASFEASTVALPTTTVTTARLDVGFVWNTVTSKWRCVASC